MKKFWSDILYRNGYLLIGAAWLFTLSFVFSNYWSYTSSPGGVKKSLEKYIVQNEESFDALLRDSVLLRKVINKKQSEEEIKSIVDKDYKVFLYEEKDSVEASLLFWSTQAILPGKELVQKESIPYLTTLTNGQYEVIRKKITVQNRSIVALALLPIRRQYVLESEYLRNGFVINPNFEAGYSILLEETSYPVVSSSGNTLFYLQPKNAITVEANDAVTVVLRILGYLLALFFIHNLAVAICKAVNSWVGIAFLATVLIGLRLLSYSFPIPVNFRQFELFDPKVYGSTLIARSLGDLLINSIIFFWIVSFTRFHLARHMPKIRLTSIHVRRVITVVLFIVLVVTTIACAHVVRSLVADSTMSFDVTNFFSLNIYSVFGFIVLCCVSLGYFIFSQTILKIIVTLFKNALFFHTIIIACIGLLLLTLRIDSPFILFELSIIIWLLAYIYLMDRVELRITTGKFLVGNVLFWLFVFSVSIATIIYMQNRSRELERRKRTAEKLVLQSDPSSERLLNIAIQGLTNNFFLSSLHRLQKPLDVMRFKDSLINANFTAYLNKYDTELFLFDENEEPLAGFEKLSYDELNSIFSVQGKTTTVPGLRYYETAFDRFSYVFQREIKDSSNHTRGYFFMLANPKRYRSEAMYPELFKQAEDYSFEYAPDYAYAIYDERKLSVYVNDYSFPTAITDAMMPAQEFEERNSNGYSELWYKAGNKVIIITHRSNFLMEAITLFAYLFCSFLLLLVLFQAASIVITSGFRWNVLKEITEFNIRSQIYATVIFVSIFSFVVIGAATILFFTASYNNNNRDKLSRTIQEIAKELKNNVSDLRILDGVVNASDSAYDKYIRQRMTELSQIHNSDLNLYNSDGTLQISSQPFVYNKGVLSRMMDPLAFYNLSVQKKIQFVQEEKYGKMTYLSIYVPVLDEELETVAYLNIPYFNAQTRLKQEISSFLVTIITLNAFIFLLSGIIALFLTNRITSSFSLISGMMKDVNLGKHNAEIVWKKNDEISELVKQYNKMVQQLEESAAALAKTEREGAWREMARQVAHEIKNPLTPMKLSIQYLQKAIYNNAPNVKELSANVAQTLVEQIDHLSRIAAEFSQFANIGNAKNEVFDLNNMLNSLVALHDVQEGVEIIWEPSETPLMIEADRTQINRLFTNLLQNAIEAIPDDQEGVVVLQDTRKEHSSIISITDNGAGIPKSVRTNIFTPNFTTKTSGTGLGLAICKGIVEQSRGSIWFETEEGVGTTFFVELPLHNEGESNTA